jgi:hypothetical protein
MDIILLRTNIGFIPASEQDAEKIRRVKLGSAVRVKMRHQRNYKLLQKTMLLMQCAYEHFCEYGLTDLEYKGEKVTPSFDRFRKDLTILAGHYTATYNIRGEVRLEANSLSYAECSEEDAVKIYNDVLSAAVKNVYKYSTSEHNLKTMVEQLSAFDGNMR